VVLLACSLSAETRWKQLYLDGAEARKSGRYQDARRLLETALAESGLDRLDTRRAQLDGALASVCHVLGETAEAERLYLEALDILENRPSAAAEIRSGILGDFASFREEQGRLGEAEELLRKAIEMSQSALGEINSTTATAKASLGHLYLTEGRITEAEAQVREAVKVHRTTLPPSDLERILSESTLGVVLTLEGRYAAAEPILQEASESARKLGETHAAYAMTLVNLADLYRFEGKSARGAPLLRKALTIYEASLGLDSPAVADALLDISITTLAERKPSLARLQIQRALAILKKAHGPDHATVAVGECRLAQSFALERRYADADKLLDHAVPILARTFPAGNPVLGECQVTPLSQSSARHPPGSYR
jgi:tetratricopeptide (TPR) repeat protein